LSSVFVLYVLFLVRYKCLLILYIYHVLQVGYHRNYYYYYKPGPFLLPFSGLGTRLGHVIIHMDEC